MAGSFPIRPGTSSPLGATFDGDGVNFAVYSRHATRVSLCLFDDNGIETQIVILPEREGHVWHGYIPGMHPGQQYGFRMHGPYAPEEGHRFNHNKLLIDPYAKKLTGHPVWHDALFGYEADHKDRDLSFDARDSAPYMPRSVVVDPAFTWGSSTPPKTPLDDTIFYEGHVKGLTAGRRDVEFPGTYRGLASEPMLDHLTDLGVTAIELLPVQAFLNDQFLVRKGLSNYWGYMTYGFFAPDPRYMQGSEITEFQQMVARFHSAGIEVILDVVYNHTAEGSEMGPTLAFRGLDNASYYRLADNPRFYQDTTGCGNALDFDNPFVLRLVLDSLRYWVEVMGVDGFRFDLCSTLGRTDGVFDRTGPFFSAIRQDPVLNRTKLIAEPWDLGPDGYQLGAYPAPFAEWNDKFRDDTRQFWRGDKGMVAGIAARLAGSAQFFDHDGRAPNASVNFLTAHDGFTMTDTVSYAEKHNEANGEGNRDGHSENHADNMGVEGPTDDPDINAARARRRRNLMATLLFSQGTPMILAGDEIGNSQQGNNNAYCQDNEIGWLDWANKDTDFLAFTKQAIAFRKAHPILRQRRFLHSQARLVDGAPDLFWRRADGQAMAQKDWDDPDLRTIVAEMRMASGTPEYVEREGALLIVLNAGPEVDITLSAPTPGSHWLRAFDTAQPDAWGHHEGAQIAATSVVVFVEKRDSTPSP
ncbi:glycogen debranching protein GlgX [Loktanella sp. Alg231-35]|uniref:glycogen debranching protein GlgX n=1 Tax=Loktanella sp. Alg231-35 TaxID=1922220 RepID=UPI000D55F41D|nr:glycogen debranching protein GlgX [Loktanella sp. Alg231-35]